MKTDSFQYSNNISIQSDPLPLKKIETSELKKIRCYISPRTRTMKRCKVCGESLISKQYFTPQNIAPQFGKYCTKCEMFHIAYAQFMKCKTIWNPVNEDECDLSDYRQQYNDFMQLNVLEGPDSGYAANKKQNKYKCYLVLDSGGKLKHCKVCGEQLVYVLYSHPKKKKDQRGKFCIKCGIFHLEYTIYVKCPDLWKLINIDDIEMIRIAVRKKKLEQKTEKKRREEAKKKQRRENNIKQRQEAKKRQETEIGRKEDTDYWQIRFTNTERVVYSEKNSKQVIKDENYLPEWIKRAAEEEKEKRLKKEYEEMRRRIGETKSASEHDTIGLYRMNYNTTVQKVGEFEDPDSTYFNGRIDKDEIKTITGQNFVVRCNTFKCRYYNHYVQDIVAVITTVSRSGAIRELQIPAGYCSDCRTYFILDSIFKRIQNAGVPICKIVNRTSNNIDSNYKDYEFGFNLKPESILMHYGYNVNQVDDLPQNVRRNILAAMIDYKVLTKNDILNHLNFLISMNQKKDDKDTEGTRRMANAISKWKADRLFVEKYEIGMVKKVPVRSIITNK